ncbi:hypothetical protein J9317_10195 [Metabacillus sp. KIGAM252]|uniref:Uncharacterized protein n=1 Tax=Metabacillus flavus TaxID=2823519 RepID=A0ABS5LEG2_9BACI|nr:hypothetical protein [Metabacillus flavus]MBS2969132.1 hypothetical protein [Metabacillus flavus]
MFRYTVILFMFTLSALLMTNVHFHHSDGASHKMIEEGSIQISEPDLHAADHNKVIPFPVHSYSLLAALVVLLTSLMILTIKRKSQLQYFLMAVFYQSSYFRTFARIHA